jgi:hypothetical protein
VRLPYHLRQNLHAVKVTDVPRLAHFFGRSGGKFELTGCMVGQPTDEIVSRRPGGPAEMVCRKP